MILWIIACIACFVLGDLKGQGKLNWVRGAAGKARDVAFGLRPASLSASVVNSVQPDILNTSDKRQSSASRAENRVSKAVIRESRITEQPDISPDIMGHKRPTNPDNGSHTDHYGLSEVSPTPPKNPIRINQAVKNIVGFLAGLARHWQLILCIIVAVVIWNTAHSIWRFASCPMGKPGILWCVGRQDSAAALENERINTQVAELEARVGALSAQLAENTSNDRRRVDHVIAEANQELAHAVETDDFEGAYSVYRRAYDGVWNDIEPTREPNPAARGPDPLPSAIASPV